MENSAKRTLNCTRPPLTRYSNPFGVAKCLLALLTLSMVSFGQVAQNRACSQAIKALKKERTPANQEAVNRSCDGIHKGESWITAPPVQDQKAVAALPTVPLTEAEVLEDRYKTCANHYIPSNECTP